MFVPELSVADLPRVSWLCRASADAAVQLCAEVELTDPAEIHCARFATQLTMNVPLPDGYAWGVLRASAYEKGRSVYQAPLEGHVRTMAMYAVDLEAAGADLAEFCSPDNPNLQQAAVFRFAHSPKALPDERLLELSDSKFEWVRHSVANVLANRQSPDRNKILKRLIEDPAFLVSNRASAVAGRTKDPELLELLAAKGYRRSLSLGGDPRGRSHVEALIGSDDPLNWEEGIGTALRLGDRGLLAKLWHHQNWDTRSSAILGSAYRGLIDNRQLDEILARESADHIVELLLRWPHGNGGALVKLGQLLHDGIAGFPKVDALVEGRTTALDQARAWMATNPRLSAAMVRLVPHESAVLLAMDLMSSSQPEARRAGTEVVQRRELTEGFPRVAELCLDPEKRVADAAADAVLFRRMRCGVYGLDTAILRAGSTFEGSAIQRYHLGRLIEALLLGESTTQEGTSAS